MTIYYTIYMTTNIVNGKIYIGKHETTDPNDSYLGSGSLLKLAIKKYGKEKFKKDILFICDNPIEMYQKESEIVNEDFIKRQDTYNLKVGGNGGWKYLSEEGQIKSVRHQDSINDKISQTCIERYNVDNPFKSKDIRNKSARTLESKYGDGITHNMKSDSVKEKIKSNLIKKYGVDNVSKTPEVKKKLSIMRVGNTHGNKKVEIDGIQYPSIGDAMIQLGLSYRKIRRILGNPR